VVGVGDHQARAIDVDAARLVQLHAVRAARVDDVERARDHGDAERMLEAGGRGIAVHVSEVEEARAHERGGGVAREIDAADRRALGVGDEEAPPVAGEAAGLRELDLMVCMDLVGYALGPQGLPGEVRSSLFALGAERSAGTAALVDDLASSERGVIIRRVDAELIPPLSDHDAFSKRKVPFLFLTASLEDRVRFEANGRDDASTLRSFLDLVAPLAALSPVAAQGQATANGLLGQCDARGRLPSALSEAPSALVVALESGLA